MVGVHPSHESGLTTFLTVRVLGVDSATSVDMTYNGIGVVSGFALKGVAPFVLILRRLSLITSEACLYILCCNSLLMYNSLSFYR
jgi:hypothetical protein